MNVSHAWFLNYGSRGQVASALLLCVGVGMAAMAANALSSWVLGRRSFGTPGGPRVQVRTYTHRAPACKIRSGFLYLYTV